MIFFCFPSFYYFHKKWSNFPVYRVSCVDCSCSVVLASIEIKLKAVSINFKIELKLKGTELSGSTEKVDISNAPNSQSPYSLGAAPASPCSRCRWPWAARSCSANQRSVLWYSDQSQLTCPAGPRSSCWSRWPGSPASWQWRNCHHYCEAIYDILVCKL